MLAVLLATIFLTGDAHLSTTNSASDTVLTHIANHIGTEAVMDCGDVSEHATEAEYMRFWTLFPAGNFIPGEHDWLDGCSHCADPINIEIDNIHMVGFDTRFYNDPGKLVDLDAALASGQPALPVLFTHVPLLSGNTRTGGDSPAVWAALEPLVEANNVKLVVSGHGHAYERHYRNGRNYVVIGTAGAELDQVGAAPYLVKFITQHGWLEIESDYPELIVTFKGVDGGVLDQFRTSSITGISEAPQSTWGQVKSLYR